MKTTQIAVATCPSCHEPLDAVTDPIGGRVPRPGDYTVCLYCNTVLVFESVDSPDVGPAMAALRLRYPTEVEQALFDADPYGTQIRANIAQMLADRADHTKPDLRVRMMIVPPGTRDVVAWIREHLTALDDTANS